MGFKERGEKRGRESWFEFVWVELGVELSDETDRYQLITRRAAQTSKLYKFKRKKRQKVTFSRSDGTENK